MGGGVNTLLRFKKYVWYSSIKLEINDCFIIISYHFILRIYCRNEDKKNQQSSTSMLAAASKAVASKVAAAFKEPEGYPVSDMYFYSMDVT